jgi:hypothetical protein
MQQIHRYEHGTNRISRRLYEFAKVLAFRVLIF